MSFSRRLLASMLAAGIFTPAELVRRCKDHGCDLTLYEAIVWVQMDECPYMSLARGLDLGDALHVRIKWLATGKGHITPITGSCFESKVLEILHAMPADRLEDWLAVGEGFINKMAQAA